MSIQNDGITERAREIEQARAEGFRRGVEAALMAVKGAGHVEGQDCGECPVEGCIPMIRALAPDAQPRGEGARLPQGPCKCGAVVLSEGKSFLPAGQAHSRAACQPAPPASGDTYTVGGADDSFAPYCKHGYSMKRSHPCGCQPERAERREPANVQDVLRTICAPKEEP
jgi:hypothetical protein